ncbi:helix-turn-helix transcriptional regulator [Embleya scabrispora]|uniref:helix-turn-helix transcriptional regulator n=1 Tax=Embleya scabrispora TaxID=159449 RepID=UPI0003656819|nr:LuxR family transcriptional regulator [Embleya scabrispora]MYS84822.1 AAA family ATPase [Streptomyces sp. SID5474]
MADRVAGPAETRDPPSAPLVGRAALLASVESRIAAGASVVLTGSSGIGKTTVVGALCGSATARGENVLRTSGTEIGRRVPYSGLTALLHRVPPELPAALAPAQRSVVGDLLAGGHSRMCIEAFAPGRPPWGGHLSGTRFHDLCGRAWRELLERCSALFPTLVVVDDAHWLDAASADVLAHALHHLAGPDVRALVAGGWPERGTTERGEDLPWLTAPLAVEVAVPPLPPEDLVELFDRHGVPARMANKLHADSGGNPYLALALAGEPSDRAPRHGRPAPLPQRVRALIGERVGRLSPQTRETLLVAALTTRPTVELLLRAGRADAEYDIRLAAATGLVVGEGGRIRFTPPAVAGVLAESARADHRARLHLALAAVVTDAAARIRHRALACADPNAELARKLATAAGEARRRRGSRRLAAELYLLAAERTPAEFDGRRLDRLVAAAEVGATAGLSEVVHRAADAVLAADALPAQRVRVRMALIDLAGQGLSEMDELFAAALLDAGEDPALIGPLRLRRSWAAMVAGDHEGSAHHAEAAIGSARTAGDRATESMALAVTAMTARITGRPDHRLHMDRAPTPAEPEPDGLLHLTPRFVAARFAVFDDRLDDARHDLLAMLARTEGGTGEEIVAVLRSLSEVSARLGRCADALHFADRAMRIAEDSGLSPGPGWYNGAIAELAGGSVARAAAYAERGVRASEQEGDSIFLERHLHALGQARLRAGDVCGGIEALRRIADPARGGWVSPPSVLRRHGDLACALALAGRLDEAEHVIRSAREALDPADRGRGTSAQLDRAEAVLCAARGEAGRAVELLDHATRIFEALRQPLEFGHCLLVLGRIERSRRRHAAARAAGAQALAVFTRCGARPWMEQASRTLTRQSAPGGPPDGRPRPDAARAFATLTETEERVARLVAEGASNREAAAALFLSVKTVEASLTRIYRKFAVRSRTQLGSHLHDALGLPEHPR